jgi:hypothetical protein
MKSSSATRNAASRGFFMRCRKRPCESVKTISLSMRSAAPRTGSPAASVTRPRTA